MSEIKKELRTLGLTIAFLNFVVVIFIGIIIYNYIMGAI